MDFILGQQEDAHELHSCILQKMHNAFVGNAADIMKTLEPADRIRAEETSLIYQLFGGHQLSHVRKSAPKNLKRSEPHQVFALFPFHRFAAQNAEELRA